MEGDKRFPKFERWLEKEYPSVYEEEFYHRSDLPIGIFLALFGWFPWLLTNFAFGPIQILGIAASLLGIILLFRAYVMHRSQLKQYCYNGLNRNTITDAIMFLDSRIVQPDDLESPAPYYEKRVDASYNLGMKERNYLRFIRSTTGLFLWPSSTISEIKSDIHRMKRETFRCSAFFLLTSIILLFWMFSDFTVYVLTGFGIVPLSLIFYTSYYYFQYVIKDMPLLDEKWIQDIHVSDTVHFEDVMNEILSQLHSEFPFPLRFHLAKEYPLLTYTGRTKTTYTLVRLKEAVLYPQENPLKEERTGATKLQS
ncbi:MAG: hypothetical protein ACFFF9_09110 [Candidatus Thorarchaeota archaeon]